MAKVLAIKSSILGSHSQSGKLVDEFINQWQARHGAEQVKVRDVAHEPLPILDGELIAGLAGNDELNERQQQAAELSTSLIAEVQQADVVVVGVPMYNFGIPAQLKAWVDLICRAGVTFRYTEQGPEGLLQGKRLLLVVAAGGLHRDSATDLALAHIKTVLGFIGLTQVEVAYAQGLNMGPELQSRGLYEARQVLDGFLAAS